jgi:hypothetical protein
VNHTVIRPSTGPAFPDTSDRTNEVVARFARRCLQTPRSGRWMVYEEVKQLLGNLCDTTADYERCIRLFIKLARL